MDLNLKFQFVFGALELGEFLFSGFKLALRGFGLGFGIIEGLIVAGGMGGGIPAACCHLVDSCVLCSICSASCWEREARSEETLGEGRRLRSSRRWFNHDGFARSQAKICLARLPGSCGGFGFGEGLLDRVYFFVMGGLGLRELIFESLGRGGDAVGEGFFEIGVGILEFLAALALALCLSGEGLKLLDVFAFDRFEFSLQVGAGFLDGFLLFAELLLGGLDFGEAVLEFGITLTEFGLALLNGGLGLLKLLAEGGDGLFAAGEGVVLFLDAMIAGVESGPGRRVIRGSCSTWRRAPASSWR